jgi:hypothetical protein
VGKYHKDEIWKKIHVLMGRKWLAASLEHVNMARKGSQNKKKLGGNSSAIWKKEQAQDEKEFTIY